MKMRTDTRTKLINTISHIAGWLLFFSLIIGFLSNSPEGSGRIVEKLFSAPFLIFYTVYLTIFYSNYFILLPRLYFKKQYALYFFIIVLLFAAVYYIKPFDRLIRINPPPGQSIRMEKPPVNDRQRLPPKKTGGGPGGKDINSIILFVTVWSMSTVISIIRQWRVTEKRALQAETDKANAELAFLKSQVNPHFLFNTLNNIYSMAVTGHAHTAPSIMRLSNIMRYITDEAGQDFVPLENEVQCMQDFIDLQRVRMGPRTQIELNISGDMHNKKIAPLLLMTFVENVFKHGTSGHDESVITIKLSADQHTIQFYSRNKKFSAMRAVHREGTGIANARKRLEHLYTGKYFLDINTEGDYFTVQLNLKT